MVERTGFEPPAIRLPERSSDSAGSHGTVENGGEGWIRTSVRLRGQIYSLLPLTTRPPLHEVPAMRRAIKQARHVAARDCRVNA